ncbi:hypothetical protein [Emcibacter nanhaiensis]|uniref:Uncharacterized protein n=1 Tax=Emcibacter nanhaiensis TaxID=1505037 RepID=A0A501PSQ6_9PROT|nr:hypothetical protein [Emcibacter nanhaiensis]TPD62806.1 hypothetical protein FIV46_01635 [Emcibacter nanhaiensis]
MSEQSTSQAEETINQDGQKETDQVVTPHPSSLRQNRINITREAGAKSWFKNYWPMLTSSILSIAWIAACVSLFLSSDRQLDRMPLYEMAGLLAGAMLPLMVIWLITLTFLRVTPLREERLALSSGLENLLSPLDIAQKRVETIVANLHKEIKHVEAAGEIAQSRIENLESRFQEQISSLFDATTTAEERTRAFQELMGTERESLTKLSGEINVQLKELETVFSQLKFDSETITNTTRKNSEKVSNEIVFQKKTLDERAQQIEARLDAMGEKLKQLTSEMDRSVDSSGEKLTGLSREIDARGIALTKTVELLQQQTGEICAKLDEQADTMGKLTGQAAADSERLTGLLKTQANELSTVAAGALAQTAEAGESFQSHAANLGRLFSEVAEKGNMLMEESSSRFAENTDQIQAIINEFSANLAEQIEDSTRRINTQNESLEHSLAARISNAEEILENQAEVIREGLKLQAEEIQSILNGNTEQIGQAIQGSLMDIQKHSETIGQQVEANVTKLNENISLMDSQGSRFEELSETYRTQLEQSEEKLKQQHDSLTGNITTVTEHIGLAIDKLKDQSSDLGAHGQAIIDNILSQTEQLATHVKEIRQRAESSLRDMQEIEGNIGEQLSAAEAKTGHITEDWRKTSDYIGAKCTETINHLGTLTERLKSLEVDNNRTAETAEANIKRISDELQHASESIYLASASAIEAADETNKVIEHHNEKFQQLIKSIQLSSNSVVADAEAFEKKISQKSGSGFSSLASRVMEQLQSFAIDIGRYVDEDVSDDLWQLYIKGDKGAFLRRLKKVSDRKIQNKVAEKCKDDPDFRRYVQDYMENFEDLMAKAMASNNNSPFAVALISSDAGKVYLALAQAVGKLS